MEMIDDEYMDIVILGALGARKGDVLSINGDEEDTLFLSELARRAREITGSGSYIQYIEDGKVIETEEAESDGPIDRAPSLMVHIPFPPRPERAEKRVLDAAELQRLSVLSDPIEEGRPRLPHVNAWWPNSAWSEICKMERDSLMDILSALFSLHNKNPLERYRELVDVTLFEEEALNKIGIKRCRIDGESASLFFSFIESSRFCSNIRESENERRFIPNMLPGLLMKIIEPHTLEGWLRITSPISLMGYRIENARITFEKGMITEIEADKEASEAFSIYLMQDENSSRASTLLLSNSRRALPPEVITGVREWDEMRGPAITIGGIRPEAMKGLNPALTFDSIVTASLPFSSPSLEIIGEDDDGEESVIYRNGMILPYGVE